MRMETVPSCSVSIFIAGDYDTARDLCSAFCDQVGLCVTVTETSYIYTGGEEAGVIVGLINYPRFPSDQVRIEAKAVELAMLLKGGLEQESFTVQTPTQTTWFSWRPADLAIADTHPKDGDVKQAPLVSGGGAEGNRTKAPTPPPILRR